MALQEGAISNPSHFSDFWSFGEQQAARSRKGLILAMAEQTSRCMTQKARGALTLQENPARRQHCAVISGALPRAG